MSSFKDYLPRRRGSHRAHRKRPRTRAHRTPPPTADTSPGTSTDTSPGTTTPPEPAHAEEPADARAAFLALYEGQAATLLRQAVVLGGDHAVARRAVARAFRLAWESWPEVAAHEDPAAWVRAVCHEHALAPWQGYLPRRWREPAEPAGDEGPLLAALWALPPAYRRALLLADGLGLSQAAVAAECEASTAATVGRLVNARAALAERLPRVADRREALRRAVRAQRAVPP
ncbi:hypothetical protein EBN88_29725, partial [Streptomyces triticirhizae]